MALITDLPASNSLASTDVFIKDTGSATQKITVSNLKSALEILPMYTFDLASNTAKALTIPNGTRHFIVISGSATARHGVFVVSTTSAGAVQLLEVAKGAGITYATSTNTLTLTAASGAATVMVITLFGSNITG